MAGTAQTAAVSIPRLFPGPGLFGQNPGHGVGPRLTRGVGLGANLGGAGQRALSSWTAPLQRVWRLADVRHSPLLALDGGVWALLPCQRVGISRQLHC